MNHVPKLSILAIIAAILLAGNLVQAEVKTSAWLGVVSINEVELNPAGDNFHRQWVELYNAGNSPIDISNWRIVAINGGKSYLLPTTVMEPKSYSVVKLPGWFFFYQNDTVELFDAAGGLVSDASALSDFGDDASTWQRSPDGSNNWGFKHATTAISNSGDRSPKKITGSENVRPFVKVDKESYLFGETLHIEGVAPDGSKLQIVNSKGQVVKEFMILHTAFEETYKTRTMPEGAQGMWKVRLTGDGEHWLGNTETAFEVIIPERTAPAQLLQPLPEQANLHGPYEHTVTLKITNTRTGIVNTKDWKITGYTFGERPIDVPDVSVKKIRDLFYTDSFSFTLHNNVFERKWLHFEVELIGTPSAGEGMTIKFV